ncbi:MAG: hypothetical protein JWO46_1790 [Nocardioidaceae bacterium]|nr:hypothetical protein [Nocardioidaceae bacterium]
MTTTKKSIKLLGQEPAALVGALEAVLTVFLSFGVLGLDQNKVALIVAAVSALLGIVTAYATKDTLLAAIIGFAKAVLVLAAAYGLSLTDSQTGSLIAVITMVGGLYLRSKTNSIATPISNASPGVEATVGSVRVLGRADPSMVAATVKDEVSKQFGKDV